MALEVSLEGQKFSTGGKKFKFIENDYQFRGVSHVTGPDSGGTVIDLKLNDFVVPNTEVPKASCLFSTYEDSKGVVPAVSPGRVAAKYIKATATKKAYVTCQTPVLPQDSAISDVAKTSKRVISHQIYTLVKVTLELLGKRTIDSFTFAYMKATKILRYDSPSLAFRVSESTLWPRRVNVIGENFIPVEN
jgi:hypothetical protein